MSPQETDRRFSSRVVKAGMVSALSLTLVACGAGSTTARCADRNSPGRGGYRVVPDGNCDPGDIDRTSTSGAYGRYFWYYGGKSTSGFVSGGSGVRPDGKIKSSSGRTLSRGGFGGSGRSGG